MGKNAELISLKREKIWSDRAWRVSCWWLAVRHESRNGDGRHEHDGLPVILMSSADGHQHHDDLCVIHHKCTFFILLTFPWWVDHLEGWWLSWHRGRSSWQHNTCNFLPFFPFFNVSLYRSLVLIITSNRNTITVLTLRKFYKIENKTHASQVKITKYFQVISWQGSYVTHMLGHLFPYMSFLT